MQIDFQKEMMHLSEMRESQRVTLLIEGDVIVPDIKSDIREVLLAEANAVVTGENCQGDTVNIAGVASLKILYLPEEGNCPKCMDSKFDFKDSLTLPGAEGLSLCSRATVEHIEFSLINSRKMNVKIVVAISLRSYGQKQLNLITEGAEGSSLKLRRKNISAYELTADSACELVVSDEIEIPAAKPCAEEIIKMDARAVKGDCKIMAGKILLKGALSLRTLYQSAEGDGGVESMEHELPFSEMVDVAGLDEGSLCNVSYQVKEIYATLKENQKGEMRLVSLDFVLRGEVRASKTRELSLVDDCYSTEGDVNVSRETITVDELLCEGTSHETLREILAIPENAPEVGAVYRLECQPKIQEVFIENERLIVKGKLLAFVLYGGVEAQEPMYSLVGEFDFDHSVPADGATEGAFCECDVTDQSVSFVLTGASEIELRCSLELYCRAVKKHQLEMVTGCEFSGEAETAEDRGLVIYFAQRGDSLWDIAKHYRTDMEKIMQINSLNQEVISPGQKILIPKA